MVAGKRHGGASEGAERRKIFFSIFVRFRALLFHCGSFRDIPAEKYFPPQQTVIARGIDKK